MNSSHVHQMILVTSLLVKEADRESRSIDERRKGWHKQVKGIDHYGFIDTYLLPQWKTIYVPILFCQFHLKFSIFLFLLKLTALITPFLPFFIQLILFHVCWILQIQFFFVFSKFFNVFSIFLCTFDSIFLYNFDLIFLCNFTITFSLFCLPMID